MLDVQDVRREQDMLDVWNKQPDLFNHNDRSKLLTTRASKAPVYLHKTVLNVDWIIIIREIASRLDLISISRFKTRNRQYTNTSKS